MSVCSHWLSIQLLRYHIGVGTKVEEKESIKAHRASGTSGFVSSLQFNCSLRWGALAGPLNTYVVNLTLRYNYTHLSHSSVCCSVSYQPSMWSAALTDGGLILHSRAAATLFQSNLLCPGSRLGSKSCWHSPSNLSRLPRWPDIQFGLQSLQGCRSDNALLWYLRDRNRQRHSSHCV